MSTVTRRFPRYKTNRQRRCRRVGNSAAAADEKLTVIGVDFSPSELMISYRQSRLAAWPVSKVYYTRAARTANRIRSFGTTVVVAARETVTRCASSRVGFAKHFRAANVPPPRTQQHILTVELLFNCHNIVLYQCQDNAVILTVHNIVYGITAPLQRRQHRAETSS